MKRATLLLAGLISSAIAQTDLNDEPQLTTFANGDFMWIIDASDTSDDPAGTSKYSTIDDLRDWFLSAGAPNLVVTQGTLTGASLGISTTATWNEGSTTFTGWKQNVTNTASAANSLLLDLQVGGSSKFSVDIDGDVIAAGDMSLTNVNATSLLFEGATADAFETSLSVVDPTADRTVTFPNTDLDFTNGFDPGGAIDIDYGSADITDHTFLTDGTGDAEIVLPDDSIGDSEVNITYSETFTILEPDAVRGVSDDLVLRKFHAEKFPNGVTITSIHIDASAAYTAETFLFEHWDNASGTTQVTVESIACSAISTEDDGTLSDATIPADYFLVVNLDDTPEDVAYVAITISYTID